LSDEKLELSKELNIPTFLVDSKFFLKRITLIVEKKIIKKIFYKKIFSYLNPQFP